MARRCGMRLLAIAIVTNMACGACGVTDVPPSENDVLSAGSKASGKFNEFLHTLLRNMPAVQ